MDPSATWIQVEQIHTLARQQVKMQQHTMLLVNTLTWQIANDILIFVIQTLTILNGKEGI